MKAAKIDNSSFHATFLAARLRDALRELARVGESGALDRLGEELADAQRQYKMLRKEVGR